MAKYRQVHVDFWQDSFILDLTPEEKYFYIYLMTNSKTSQCGIYELPKRVIELETGYNGETVDKLIQRFIDYGKIDYDNTTKEIMLVNWIKYNTINSPKVKACIKKELETIKNKDFIKNFYKLCKRYGYDIDMVSIDLGEEKEEEKEGEGEKEPAADAHEDAIVFFENNFGITSPFIVDQIESWVNDFDSNEIVIAAMKIALTKGANSFGYCEAILKEWHQKGLRSIEAIRAYEKRKKEFKSSKKTNTQNGNAMPRAYQSLLEWADEEDESQRNHQSAWYSGS